MASPASEGSAIAGCSRRRSGALWSLVAVCALTCCGFRCAGAAFSIPEEAQVLSAQMKRLSAQELGVFAMQVRDMRRSGRLFFFCDRDDHFS